MSTGSRSRARSRRRASRRGDHGVEVVPVPSSGLIASCPPSSAPIAHGEPTSPGSASRALFRPLRFVWPIGCTGGRYTTSKPSSASCGSTSHAAKPPHERGKSSYHAPNRASSRSTSTSRSAKMPHLDGRRPDASPSSTVSTRGRAALHPPAARREVRLPRLGLAPISSCQVATRSVHAAPRTASAGPVDDERAAPAVVAERPERRVAEARSPGARTRTAPASVSCPSLKTVAYTATVSPTVRFTAYGRSR